MRQALALIPNTETTDRAQYVALARGLVKEGEITTKMFRHTYISARIQTTHNGVPVAAFTVAREVGHSSTAMIEKVYGHLGQVQHRSEVVEYRIGQHKKAIRDRKLRHTLRHTLDRVA